MPIQTVTIYNISELKTGDVVLTEDTFDDYPTVQREVPVEPFVPNLEVWRARTGNGEDISNRHKIWVGKPNSWTGTYYVRKDED